MMSSIILKLIQNMTNPIIRQQEIKDDPDYKLVTQLMSIPRLCGILQSDGHFNINYDREKVQNARIIITQTGKRIPWLYGLQDYLLTKDIKVTIPPPKTIKEKVIKGESINITIERVNCRVFLELIKETEEIFKTPLLFDKKRVSYLLLCESVKIKQDCKHNPLTEQQAAMLVDIKESGIKLGNSNGPRGLSRDQLIDRLGFPGVKTEGQAKFLIEDTERKVHACGVEVLNRLSILSNPTLINPALADFIAGVFDGDGSYAVGLFTHLTQDGKKLPKRHTFEIVPFIKVTTYREKDLMLFKIIYAAFGKKPHITEEKTNNKENQGNSVKLEIKNAKFLKEYVVPFFKEYPPSLNKNEIRFNTFCEVLSKLPLDYRDKKGNLEIIRFIYETDLYERNKTLEEYLKIVELDYEV